MLITTFRPVRCSLKHIKAPPPPRSGLFLTQRHFSRIPCQSTTLFDCSPYGLLKTQSLGSNGKIYVPNAPVFRKHLTGQKWFFDLLLVQSGLTSALAWVLTEVALGQKKTRARRGRCLGMLGGTPAWAERLFPRHRHQIKTDCPKHSRQGGKAYIGMPVLNAKKVGFFHAEAVG